MKILFAILLIIFFSHIHLFSQPCLPEGITFTTQSQIDSFQVNYPNCTQIEGDVFIGDNDSTSIINLNGLSILISLDQDLWINNNLNLISLSGLDNISNIGGSLVFSNNSNIIDLEGMDAIISIGGDMDIRDNMSLMNFDGLNNLTAVGGSLQIYDNDNLASLDGLENLGSIGGDLIIGYSNILYGGNPSLSDITGLSMLTSIGGILRISNNDLLSSLEGLDNLDATTIYGIQIDSNFILSECGVESICEYIENPYGTVIIAGNAPGCNNPQEVIQDCFGICLPNGIVFTSQDEIDNFPTNHPDCFEIAGNVIVSGDNISNLNGLSVLTSIWGSFLVGGNPDLFSLEGIENLNYIGESFLIVDNDILTDLSNLNNLTHIGGSLKIADNDSLTSLTGLANIEFLGNYLRVINNPNLTSLVELSNITGVGGDLEFFNNDNLVNLTGLGNIQTIDGDLIIKDNDFLESFVGLNNLASVSGRFQIKNNDALPDFSGLDNLTLINGLEVKNNNTLTSLTGLESLSNLWGNLFIDNNNMLSSLMMLGSVSSGGIENLEITNNINLSECDAQSICDHLISPNGTMEISDNAPGCNSVEEVMESCLTSVDEVVYHDEFSISPNPSAGSVYIRFTIPLQKKETGQSVLRDTEIVICDLFDITGTKVKSIINEEKTPGNFEVEVDLHDLQAGIYFFVLKTSTRVYTNKLIKL